VSSMTMCPEKMWDAATGSCPEHFRTDAGTYRCQELVRTWRKGAQLQARGRAVAALAEAAALQKTA
jgi:hypothetical protein